MTKTIVVWSSTPTSVLSYCLSRQTNDSEILLINEFRTASYHQAEELDEKAKRIIAETSEELLQFALPSFADKGLFPAVPMIHGLPGNKYKVFETHSDIVPHFTGEAVDEAFSVNMNSWINGLIDCLKTCLLRRNLNLLILPGRTFDPIFLFLQHFLQCLGVKVRIHVIYERKIAGMEKITERILPVATQAAFRLDDPDALMLLLAHYLSHTELRSEKLHKTLNVARVATKLLSSNLSTLLPPKRGESRSYDGLYKAFKKISEAMVDSGLLENNSSSRCDEYRLTELGHAYAKIILMCKESFERPLRDVLDSMKNIQEQNW